MLAVVLLAFAEWPYAVSQRSPSMGFWPDYDGGRKVMLLDGEWEYGLMAGAELSFDSMNPHLDPRKILTPNRTVVPMTMDTAAPGWSGPRGVAVYRRTFTQREGPARLQFNACSFYCRVWVDGQEIGDHRAGGYVGFTLDVPSVQADRTRELFVLADNRFNSTTAPMHTGGDFWHYGGLMRSVLLHDLPSGLPWPWRAYVFPTEHGYRQGIVDLQVVLTDKMFSGSIDLTLRFDDNSTTQISADAERGLVQLSHVSVPSPRLWEIRNPQLHTISVLGADGSGITERFGLRWWGVDATSRLMLNGNVVKLHGWNHHTQWPETGASPTAEQMTDDMLQMISAGTNYVRGAHYPQDQRWLDLLDETGVVMWEEALGPGVKVENTLDWDFFMKYQLQQLDEMLDMSLNHASIMTWGWFNEGPSKDPRACPAYKACSDRVHARDPTRFRTWADNNEMKSQCLEHASLISFNSYPAWYDKPNLSHPAEHWSAAAQAVHSSFPGKPFVISETGAGAVFEWANNVTDARWTQKYQTEVITRDVDVALKNEHISGITLWHFFDFKGNDGAQSTCGPCDYLPGIEPPTCGFINVSCDRPGGENHKGVVDFWRRPKQAYAAVAAQFKEAAGVVDQERRSEVIV